jgi:hypothetical protein
MYLNPSQYNESIVYKIKSQKYNNLNDFTIKI